MTHEQLLILLAKLGSDTAENGLPKVTYVPPHGKTAQNLNRRPLVGGQDVRLTYVATHSICHMANFVSHLDTRFSISHFERSVLGCIDSDFHDQMLVRIRILFENGIKEGDME